MDLTNNRKCPYNKCIKTIFYIYKFELQTMILAFPRLYCAKIKRHIMWHHIECQWRPNYLYPGDRFSEPPPEHKDMMIMDKIYDERIHEAHVTIYKKSPRSIKIAKDIVVSKLEKSLYNKNKIKNALAETCA